MKKLLAIVLLLNSLLILANPAVLYPFAKPEQAKQFQQLTYQLRCLVCQNQTIAESDAALAADLREQIAEKIRVGQSNEQIINYLVARYGNFILYKPPFTTQTSLLWLLPFSLLIIGILSLLIIIKKNKQANYLLTAQQIQQANNFLDKNR